MPVRRYEQCRKERLARVCLRVYLCMRERESEGGREGRVGGGGKGW